jgi:hypothetical protein
MKIVAQIEHRASSRRGKHEGEPSFGLCDRLSRTRDNSQRQLPTDQDYAVPTREYQTDQSSLKTAPTAARSVLEQRRKQQQKQTHRSHTLTRSLHIRPMHSSSKALTLDEDVSLDKRASRHFAPLFLRSLAYDFDVWFSDSYMTEGFRPNDSAPPVQTASSSDPCERTEPPSLSSCVRQLLE